MTQEGEEHGFAPLDAAECRAGGMEPEEALALSVAGSTAAFTHWADGALLCYWGYRVRPLVVGGVDAWLLGTGAVKGRGFIRDSKRLLAGLLEEYGTVRCTVWEGHAPARRWLEWLGFRAVGRESPFLHMEKRRSWGS